ncbi:SEL1-like repeat protein [Blastochloris sulfoviridis]|uniref:Sel1 repeat family protein n=1 Tax=Blastochloris sulfoviridis TaxID=50712 RepID=A0A5M6I6I0_9HYPH|nr:SEL1-like repeat protein [Blastochloris sulfoviridis]KAA5603445.1 hypothetical protein F1193_02025 [Blastochloris sulfoviridis]
MAADLAADALDAARAAAEREGVSLERWLERVLQAGTGEAGERSPPRRPATIERPEGPDARCEPPVREPEPAEPGTEGVAAALGEVSRRLNALLGEVAGAPPRAGATHPRDGLGRPAGRAGAERRSGLESPQLDLHRRLNELAGNIEAMNERLHGAAEARAGRRPLFDAAVAEINARQRLLDERAGLRGYRSDYDEVASLRRDVSDLSRTVSYLSPCRSLEALDASVRALHAQVEATAQPPIDIDQLNDMTRMLIEVREGVREIQAEAGVTALGEELKGLYQRFDALDESRLEPGAVDRLTGQISELRATLEQFPALTAADGFTGELQQLAAKAERIGSVLEDAAAALETMEGLDRKLDALAETLAATSAGSAEDDALEEIRERLDRLQVALENTVRNAPIAVERSMLLLVDKLDRLQALIANGPDLGSIDSRLDQIVERLDQSDSRLGQLDAIERGLNDLFAQIEESRCSAIDAARAAVRDLGVTPVNDLMRDLSDLRTAQRETEVRTHGTLETVHGTLERVVDRLAMLEEDIARRGDGPSAERAERPAASPPPKAPLVSNCEPAPEAASDLVRDLPADQSPDLASDLPPDLPLEPGSRMPLLRSGTVATGAMGSAAGATAPGLGGKPLSDATSKASFIAAARRAAQQATAEGSAPAAASDDAPAQSGVRAALARHRTLILAGVVLLLVAAAAPIILPPMLGKLSKAPKAEAPAIEAPATVPAAPPGEPADVPAEAPPAAPGPQSSMPRDPVIALAPSSGVVQPAISASSMPAFSAGLLGSSDPDITSSTQPAAATLAPTKPEPLPAAIGPQALREAALAGDAAAQFEVATRYAEGRGVPQSLSEALRWYDRAAQQGSIPAAYRLGSLYEKGQGVTRDLVKARSYYTRAAEAGNAKAIHNLAVLYAEGIDGKPDYRQAGQFFRRAADHGLRDSQYNLGILYARGLGVEQNMAESFKWFALAASQGDTEAQKKRDDVANRLDAQTLLAARLAVQTWAAQPLDPEANDVRSSADWDRAAGAQGKKAAGRS